jgi:hypothetical protein
LGVVDYNLCDQHYDFDFAQNDVKDVVVQKRQIPTRIKFEKWVGIKCNGLLNVASNERIRQGFARSKSFKKFYSFFKKINHRSNLEETKKVFEKNYT